MAEEIERKFLPRDDRWRDAATHSARYRQGYLAAGQGTSVRVRLGEKRAFLTIKGATQGIRRVEFEYEIPLADAQQIFDELCAGGRVSKTRHYVPWQGHTWEVDEFDGDNVGLVVAEIELDSVDQGFARPPWLGEEVSDDPRYFNAALARQPFARW